MRLHVQTVAAAVGVARSAGLARQVPRLLLRLPDVPRHLPGAPPPNPIVRGPRLCAPLTPPARSCARAQAEMTKLRAALDKLPWWMRGQRRCGLPRSMLSLSDSARRLVRARLRDSRSAPRHGGRNAGVLVSSRPPHAPASCDPARVGAAIATLSSRAARCTCAAATSRHEAWPSCSGALVGLRAGAA
jgi:hypothetical protein